MQTYTYDVNKASTYITEHALSKSHICCAWFVMRGMQAGGCPIGIYPAHYYSTVLPKYGFKEIKTTNYQKGDVIVFPAIKNHKWGHMTWLLREFA